MTFQQNRRVMCAILVVCLTALSRSVVAQGFWDQFKDPMDGRFDASNYLADNAYGFLPVPIIITDPAVDGGLGAVGLFFHETEEQKEQHMKALRESENGAQFLLTPNISAAALAVTGNESWFAGVGRAANEIDDLDEQSSKVAKGGGFRYLVARQYVFEMGLDIAVGPEETVIYIQAGTAWR